MKIEFFNRAGESLGKLNRKDFLAYPEDFSKIIHTLINALSTNTFKIINEETK